MGRVRPSITTKADKPEIDRLNDLLKAAGLRAEVFHSRWPDDTLRVVFRRIVAPKPGYWPDEEMDYDTTFSQIEDVRGMVNDFIKQNTNSPASAPTKWWNFEALFRRRLQA
jgi:hypothetical protein